MGNDDVESPGTSVNQPNANKGDPSYETASFKRVVRRGLNFLESFCAPNRERGEKRWNSRPLKGQNQASREATITNFE